MGIQIQWDAYKPTSGKWGYGGTVTISGTVQPWEREALLAEVAGLQREVHPEVIRGGHWIISLRETEAQSADPDYHRFYTGLYLPTQPWE